MRLSFSSSGLDYDICRYSRAKTVLERREEKEREKSALRSCTREIPRHDERVIF